MLIGLGALASGVTAYALLNGNEAPDPGTIVFTPTGTAMAGATFTFTVFGARDPDGDRLQYAWSFGDGTHGTGATVQKVYDVPGAFGVVLTVSDGELQSVAPAARATVARNMTGCWFGGVDPALGSGFYSICLTQTGATLGGSLVINDIAGTRHPLAGGVSALTYPCRVEWMARYRINGLPFEITSHFDGTVDAAGMVMSGALTTSGNGQTFRSQTSFRR